VLSALVCLVGVAALQVLGAGLRALLREERFAAALASPSSAWVALALLYPLSLGVGGLAVLLPLGAALALACRRALSPSGTAPWAALASLALVVLARPWVPTLWDEFVWLGKARLESLGFGTGAAFSLEPAQHLVPQGYPTLWPSAVGWLSLGRDALEAHVLAGSCLLLLAAAAALEVWWPRVPKGHAWSALAVLAVPLAWVHLRSTYVDVPVGLLGLAVLGHLLRGAEEPSPTSGALAVALAVPLVALKDEGLAHLAAATLAAVLCAEGPMRARVRLLLPLAVGASAVGVWRLLSRLNAVPSVDHALASPELSWAPRLVELLALHATDIYSWGLLWPMTLAACLLAPSGRAPRALRWMLAGNLALVAAALLTGPERVRVFAENGTLINRLLLQLWPCAALLVLLALRGAQAERSPSAFQTSRTAAADA
jgi:hypothetical protein